MNLASFKAAAINPDVGLRFYAQIQGLPYVFLDGPTPKGPTGSTWAAPTSQSEAYELVEYCLDPTSMPIKDAGAEITRSKADVSSATLSLLLREARNDQLLYIFARDLATGHTAGLTAAVDYDSAGTGIANIDVLSTTGWSAGYLYFGRETMKVTVSTGTRLISNKRDLFNDLGDGDSRALANPNRPGAPRIVSDYPRVWHGRYVRVFAYVVGPDGTAYDTAFGGDYCIEVWRGVIDGNPIPARDRLSWEIRTTSIEKLLTTTVGLETTRGTLNARRLLHDAAGAAFLPDGVEPSSMMYFDVFTAYMHFRVSQWATRASYEAEDPATLVWDHTDGVALSDALQPRLLTFEQLVAKFVQVRNQVRTDTSDGLSVDLVWYSDAPQLRWVSSDGLFYRIELDFAAVGSFGPVLGFLGTSIVEVSTVGGGLSYHTATGPQWSVWIPSHAKVIPIFLDPGEGNLEEPPSSGYARIGEGESAEIISYAAVSALTGPIGDITGGYYLEGCERGRLGTRPLTFGIPLDEAEGGEAARVTFGVGWERRSSLELLLELATSTGAGHHGDWDVLPDRITTPLIPAHFDVIGFEELSTRLSPIERSVSWFLGKPERLGELVAGWLQPHGRYLHATTIADGTYRITAGEVLPPLESEVAATLDASEVDLRDPDQWRPGSAEVINALKVFCRWDFTKSEQDEKSYVQVIDLDSVDEYGRRADVEWKLRGLLLEPDQARSLVMGWAQDIFRRYGRPYELLRLKTGRAGWFLRPGSTVTVDLDHVPTTEGTRGLDRLGVVLQASKTYSGDDPGAVVDIVFERPDRASTYAPSARVDAYNAATPSITLSDTDFSRTGELDYEHFDAGDVVLVYLDQADASTRVQRTIVSRSGAVCTLSATVPGLVAGATTLVVGADYGSVQASQRQHAHIVPNTLVFGTSPTDPFVYA